MGSYLNPVLFGEHRLEATTSERKVIEMGTLLEQLYVTEMSCPRCDTKDLKLTDNKVLYCDSLGHGHRITPEERFLFLEAWVENLLESVGRDDGKIPRKVVWGGHGWVFE